ncbi:hypothetical protein DMUE_6067, partial [Dictyocoela muelleri]
NINRIRNNEIENNKYDSLYDIPEELKYTISGYKYVQYDSGVLDKNRIILLANSEKLCFLKNSKIWLSDGTFKMTPLNFYQIYVIYAEIFDNNIPIVFGILSSKTEESYSRFFEEVKRIAGNYQSIYWIFDFEPAPVTCAKKIFPQTKFYFCLFHLSQIFWRDIQQNDLVKNIKIQMNFVFTLKCYYI